MLKKQPTIHDQHAWAMTDCRNSHVALSAMIEKLHRGEVTPNDCRPYFEMCQHKDQKLLDIEAMIRREHIRTMDVKPIPEDLLGVEINRQNALNYLLALQKQVS